MNLADREPVRDLTFVIVIKRIFIAARRMTAPARSGHSKHTGTRLRHDRQGHLQGHDALPGQAGRHRPGPDPVPQAWDSVPSQRTPGIMLSATLPLMPIIIACTSRAYNKITAACVRGNEYSVCQKAIVDVMRSWVPGTGFSALRAVLNAVQGKNENARGAPRRPRCMCRLRQRPPGTAGHRAISALFWAMDAGSVSGVGFRPHFRLWRAGFRVWPALPVRRLPRCEC